MKSPGSPSRFVRQIVADQKSGRAAGIYSVCSANRWVIEACMRLALQDGSPLLVESTSNQVNQFGGYTGMTPQDFAGYLKEIAACAGFPNEKIILGGDHLGPNAWQNEPAVDAMAKSRKLVADCIHAGYAKIHLDASMRCVDDPADRPLDVQISAERAADLCQAAESACAKGSEMPVYVIGTEVPPPGGAVGVEAGIHVTGAADVWQTIETTRVEFNRLGLQAAWERVTALVVQPGVEYGDDILFEYDRAKAAHLSRLIEDIPGMVFEAHSTDYQSRFALRQMVEDHFAILKVGPALTFALREAFFALELMEKELLGRRPGWELSRLQETLDKVMEEDPRYWKKYFTHGSEDEIAIARRFSFSDRVRYYWPNPRLAGAVDRLITNLESHPLPLTLVSQFMPEQYRNVRDGVIPNQPRALVYDRVMSCAGGYVDACRIAG